MVKLYHPELDRIVSVRERVVPVLEKSGWWRVDEAGPTDEEFAAMVEELVEEAPESGEEEE